jgi:hypothetical protein
MENQALIVADEVPAMEVLAKEWEQRVALRSAIIAQDELPGSLTSYPVVVVYIHGNLEEQAERAFIGYATGGGRLILLHHSISSGKRRNPHWFSFLGISLPEGPPNEGGYHYAGSVCWDVVNLAPQHQVTSTGVHYDHRLSHPDPSTGAEEERPAFHLEDTEIFLNHTPVGPRTILLGLQFTSPQSGTSYRQNTAGWYRPAGSGWVMYFMPGHTATDFTHPAYAQILANAATLPLLG